MNIKKLMASAVFLTLFLLSLQYNTSSPSTTHTSWLMLPGFVYYFMGLQFLLAVALFGFSRWVWEPEAKEKEALNNTATTE